MTVYVCVWVSGCPCGCVVQGVGVVCWRVGVCECLGVFFQMFPVCLSVFFLKKEDFFQKNLKKF